MKKKTLKKKKSAEPECINVFWNILPGWDQLSFNEKSEHYWKYNVRDGIRIISILEVTDPKTERRHRK